jgi:hypothetical protein
MTRQATAKAIVTAKGEAQRVFMKRATRALEQVAGRLHKADLVRVLGSSNDAEFLISALTIPGALPPQPQPADVFAQAYLRGAQQRDRILGRADMLGVEQVAQILGLTRQAVDLRRRKGRLVGLQRERRGYLYPAWQFLDGGLVPGLEDVLAALDGPGPWTAYRFFTARDPRLRERCPIDVLRAGHIEAVKDAALAFGEQGAA